MVLKVPTSHKKVQLVLRINSPKRNRIFAVGYDSDLTNKHADYFRRELFLESGLNEFIFNMPLSPKTLEVIVFDPFDKQNKSFEIKSWELNALKQFPLYCDKLTAEFVRFSENFSQKCGNYPLGSYTDPKKQFLIRYMNELLDDKGNSVPTPARTHKRLDFIEVHKPSYIGMTIPMRHIITLHEYCHNFINDERDNEIQADLNALSLYMPLRYSYVEAVYAFTKIFGETDNNVIRLNFIDKYLRENNLEKRNNKQQYIENDTE